MKDGEIIMRFESERSIYPREGESVLIALPYNGKEATLRIISSEHYAFIKLDNDNIESLIENLKGVRNEIIRHQYNESVEKRYKQSKESE